MRPSHRAAPAITRADSPSGSIPTTVIPSSSASRYLDQRRDLRRQVEARDDRVRPVARRASSRISIPRNRHRPPQDLGRPRRLACNDSRKSAGLTASRIHSSFMVPSSRIEARSPSFATKRRDESMEPRTPIGMAAARTRGSLRDRDRRPGRPQPTDRLRRPRRIAWRAAA